jgi:hypothetical protein
MGRHHPLSRATSAYLRSHLASASADEDMTLWIGDLEYWIHEEEESWHAAPDVIGVLEKSGVVSNACQDLRSTMELCKSAALEFFLELELNQTHSNGL